MMYNFCKIVQDLLPNYMEKTTFYETNQFIEEHLEQCEECTKIYNNMKSNLEIPTENIDKGVDYMKKFNKEVKHLKFWKTVLIVIALIIGILAGIVLYRYSVLTNLYNLEVANSKLGNIYYEYKHKDGNTVIKQYQKNNVIKFVKGGTSDTDGNIKMWKNLNTGETYTIIEDTKQYLEGPAGFPIKFSFVDNRVDTIIKRLKLALDMNFLIQTIEYDNKDCYKLTETTGEPDHKIEKIYEKSTGLVVFIHDTLYQNVVKNNEALNEDYFTWGIGTVTDEDVAKPDLSQYEYIESGHTGGVTGEFIED